MPPVVVPPVMHSLGAFPQALTGAHLGTSFPQAHYFVPLANFWLRPWQSSLVRDRTTVNATVRWRLIDVYPAS